MATKRTSEPEIAVSNSAAGAVPARRKTPVTRKKHTPATSVPEPLTEVVSITAEPVTAAAYQPTHADISALAYSYWVARGYQDGSPEEDWLRAEHELTLAAVAANV